MRKLNSLIKITTVFATLLIGLSCAKKTDLPADAVTPTTGTTLFTATDIQKVWTSGCLAGVDPITGGNRYKVTLTFFANLNFSYDMAYYTGGICTGGTALSVYNTSGTYTVGAAITGGQVLNFVANASDVMPMVTAAQAPLYTDCTNTLVDENAPHNNLQTPAAGYNGHHFETYVALCQTVTFPNSSNKNISNVATFSNSVLSIGTPAVNLPGVFVGNTFPTSATLQLF